LKTATMTTPPSRARTNYSSDSEIVFVSVLNFSPVGSTQAAGRPRAKAVAPRPRRSCAAPKLRTENYPLRPISDKSNRLRTTSEFARPGARSEVFHQVPRPDIAQWGINRGCPTTGTILSSATKKGWAHYYVTRSITRGRPKDSTRGVGVLDNDLEVRFELNRCQPNRKNLAGANRT